MVLSSAFAADLWLNFGRPFPVRSILPYSEGVLVASATGLRYITRTKDSTQNIDAFFSTQSGLGTSSFYALSTCGNGIFAVSEFGLVARWDTDHENWIVYNRSYVSNGVRLVPDMVVGSKDYLVLAFEDRLAFFDTYNRRSVLTINKIGKNALLATPVQAMSIHGDTLYVSVGTTLYKRGMDWDNLKDDIFLVDPETWIVEKEGEIIESIAWKGDSLKTFTTKGYWHWNEKGQLTSVVPDSGIILVEDEPVEEELFYSEGKTSVSHVAISNGDVFLAGEYFVSSYNKKTKVVRDYSLYPLFKLDGTNELKALPEGGVMAASPEGRFSYTENDFWHDPYPIDDFGNGRDALSNRMKVLSFLPPDKVFYHVWGRGFFLFSNYGRKLEKAVMSGDKTNFNKFDVSADASVIVTAGTTVAPDSSGFLTTSATDGGFDLIYVSKDGEFSSVPHAGFYDFAGAMVSAMEDESSNWLVFVSGRSLGSADAEGALEFFRVTNPAKNGGRLAVLEHRVIYSPFKDTPVDMAYDKKGKYLWLVTKSQLEYWDTMDGDSLKTPNSVKGVVGSEYTSLEFDVLGNLWIGTMGRGVYRLSRKGLTQDTLVARQFSMKDGMLNDDVLDVAIDDVRGEAWFSHERGTTMYRRSDLRNAELSKTDAANAKIKAYPNPFRLGMHKYITIDNIGADAVVSIYNRAGHMIRSFDKKETSGGSAEWNGYSKRGNLAAPGVYWYVVKKPSGKSEKGKFILVH